MAARFDEKFDVKDVVVQEERISTDDASTQAVHSLHRRLGNRQIQLIAIGGSIGTAVFVSIASGLTSGGPAGLLLAFLTATIMMGFMNNAMAEMTIHMPVEGAFVRMATHWCDDALGALAGWNFFLYEAILVPFEISALNLVLSFWRDDIPLVAVICVCIALYALINFVAVKYYGESEFWLAGGKLVLFLIVFFFTLVTMCGGNPRHDAYGFRNWSTPGAFAAIYTTGDLGRFHGYLGALTIALFTVCGPEYISMIAGEAQFPRKYLKSAFKTTFYRFAVFFIGSALCVGIVISYTDKRLLAGEGTGTAAGSPYVAAMYNLGIDGLPHLTNALLVTSIFSAGNAYTYCASRTLYGLALDGKAPKIFSKTTKSGVPVAALALSLAFSLLAFLGVSKSAGKVLGYLVDVLGAGQIINYIVICITYISFYRGTQAQGLDRKTLPYCGWFQPYGTYIALVFYVVMLFVRGYTVFLDGQWDISTFFTSYTLVAVAPAFFVIWKFAAKTKWVKASQVDLVWEAPLIDAYEEAFAGDQQTFWTEMVQMVGFRRNKKNRHDAEFHG